MHIISLINFNIHHLTLKNTDSLVQRRCVFTTRRVGGRKGLRLAISDLVTVSVESGGKHVPIDALPVAARRVLHHEASGDHEPVDMLSLQVCDDSAGAYDARSLYRHCANVLAFVPLLATLA